MENLNVKIIFKSGRVKYVESRDYYKGQLRQWIDRNFVKNEYEKYNFVIWDDLFININEIEIIEEV